LIDRRSSLSSPTRDPRALLQGVQPPDASIEMARLLDVPPVLTPNVLRGDTRLTRRWLHGGLREDYMRGVGGHVAVGCHSGEHPISWRVENKVFESRTSRQAFTLIPASVDGHWNIGGQVVVSHVYLTPERVQACADEIAGGRRAELLVRVAHTDPVVAALVEILSHEAARDDVESPRLFVEQAIDLLCVRLVLEHSSLGGLTVRSPRRGLADWQVRKIAAYIKEHLGESIGLDELAAEVGLSRFHFCSAFRQATGRTPYAWLTAERIRRARELLMDRRFSITDVALAVGYATPSAFAATFRRIVGVTPTQFRHGQQSGRRMTDL